MSLVSTSILAFSMSADAFAVALGKGASERNPRLMNALKTGALFGVVEGITPLLGWCIGIFASSFIASIDHWIAFIILGGVGLRMMYESFQVRSEADLLPRKPSFKRVMLTAFATSIDALAVGVTLAFMDINIWLSSAAIGTATFVMVTLGVMIGHYIGTVCGRISEALGGVALVLIGSRILCEHLHIF